MLRDFLENLKNKKLYIVGLSGSEGTAAARFLIKYKLDKNTEVEASDFSSRKDFKENFYKLHAVLSTKERDKYLKLILNSNVKIHYKDDYLKNIEKADIIFASQGWIKHKPNYPKLASIFKSRKDIFLSITKLYLELIEGEIIGITGSNGKSTTTKLAYEICKRSPRRTFFAGNDRNNIQILDRIEKIQPKDIIVLEISDRQLIMPIQKSPHIVVILNIVPNHLDDHGTFRKYIEVKKRILYFQTKKDFAVLNFDNKITRALGKEAKAKVCYFSRRKKLTQGAYLDNDRIIINISGRKEIVTTLDKIKVPGMHNVENILAASLAARLAGVSIANIRNAVESFRGLRQRLEYVTTKKGRKFYYDRQGTTPDATITSLRAFSEDIILIAGGDDKGMDYGKLADTIKERVKLIIVLPGSGTEKIIKELKKRNYNDYKKVKNVKEAVKLASSRSDKGNIILLSPACVYAKFEFMGKQNLTFYDFVKKLKISRTRKK